MIKNEIFNSIIGKSDFARVMHTSLSLVTTTPGDNQWTYIDTENSAHVKNTTADGYGNLALGKLYAGDIIEIQAEMLNISGIKAKVWINLQGGSHYNTPSQSKLTNEYEKVTVKHIVTKDGNYSAGFGVYYQEVSEFKMRNIAIKVHTLNTSESPSVRKAVIFNPSGGSNFVLKTDRNNDSCSIAPSVNWLKGLEVTFEKPLRNVGIAFVGLEWFGLSHAYMVRCSYASESRMVLKFYDMANPKVEVDLASLPANIYVNLMLVG